MTGIDRHVAPAQEDLPFDRDQTLKLADRRFARLFLLRKEAHANGIIARRGELDRLRPRPIAQQRVGQLDHAAGTITAQRVGADPAAMIEIGENLEPVADDPGGFLASDMRDKANAARIMFVARVV